MDMTKNYALIFQIMEMYFKASENGKGRLDVMARKLFVESSFPSGNQVQT